MLGPEVQFIMPELPEVETVARGLNGSICGERITAVEILRKESVAYPLAGKQFSRKLVGLVFENFFRRGKYILSTLSDGSTFIAHLRMSGRLVVKAPDVAEDKFLRVRICLASGRELHFEDMRVFGRLWHVPSNSSPEKVCTGLASLGKEPLSELTVAHLKACFKGKKQPVKSSLLDQRIVAGIGNIYADECLFLSEIHPQRSAGSLNDEDLERLLGNIKLVLTDAIAAGGSTLRDYTDSQGVNGNYQNLAWVYGRAKETCRNCPSIIERVKLAGRSSHFCPVCQPLKRSRGVKSPHLSKSKAR